MTNESPSLWGVVFTAPTEHKGELQLGQVNVLADNAISASIDVQERYPGVLVVNVMPIGAADQC